MISALNGSLLNFIDTYYPSNNSNHVCAVWASVVSLNQIGLHHILK